MAFSYDKDTGDIVINGFEKGIAPSPHQGIASIRNANIATELGEAMCNFQREQVGGNNISISLTVTSTSQVRWPAGYIPYVNQTIKITSTPASGPTVGVHWVADVSEVGGFYFTHLYASFDEASHGATGESWVATSGTAVTTLLGLTSTPVAGTSETYYNGTNLEYRYYIAESAGYVWCMDTGLSMTTFELIDSTQITAGINGLVYYNGHLFAFSPEGVSFKITCILAQNPTDNGSTGWGAAGISDYLNSSPNSYIRTHFALSGHSGLFYTDANFIGSMVATLPSFFINFAYGQYTITPDNTITVNPLYAGAFPINNQTIGFYNDTTNGQPTGIALETVYYVINAAPEAGTFQISTIQGDDGSVHDISGGTGNQYFNSFDPTNGTVNGNSVGGSNPTFTGTTQACILPFFESATALAELGNDLVIGTLGSTLYVWDEGAGGASDITPQGFIPMAENNCAFLLTVNNVVFDFRGQKGNIYVTSGSAASGVLTVPDYLSGTPGNPTSYIEPYWTFGQAFFQRGRVFFSVWDNNGNACGVYSFVPSFFNPVTGQDAGLSLRLENYNSYSNYTGSTPVLLNNLNQNAIGVQYFSAWVSGISTYGIDTSGTIPYTGGQTVIETDLIPVGTYFNKTSFKQYEYKLSTPLALGESVQIKWRTDATSVFTSAGSNLGETTTTDGSGTIVSGYFNNNTQNAQWFQLQIILTSTATNPSFVRLVEVRIR